MQVLCDDYRAATPLEGSLYCAYHTEATRGAAAPNGDQARSSSSRRLSVLRLPHRKQEAARGDQARSSSSRRLSVLRLPHRSEAGPSGAQRRPSAQQLLQKALCTAPATQQRSAAQRRPAATTRAAAPPEGSLYCACHTAAKRGSGAPRRPSAQQLLQKALCTAPATQKARRAQLRPAATKRAETRPGGSLYCACHAKATARPSGAQRRPSAQQLLQEALYTAPATQKPPHGPAAPSGDQARSSSFRRLSILRLPRKNHRAAQRRPAATKRAAAPSGGSLYCTCHTKATARPSGAQRRPSAQQLRQEALCTAPATQKPARRSSSRRLSVLRLPHNSHRAAQRRPAATKRAAAPSGGSLYCACHTKARRTPAAPSGDQARRSSSRRLSVLRLPHKSHRAAQRRPAATKRAEAPSYELRYKLAEL